MSSKEDSTEEDEKETVEVEETPLEDSRLTKAASIKAARPKAWRALQPIFPFFVWEHLEAISTGCRTAALPQPGQVLDVICLLCELLMPSSFAKFSTMFQQGETAKANCSGLLNPILAIKHIL